MRKLGEILEAGLRLLLVAFLGILVLVVLIQVAARLLSKYVSSAVPATPWTEELAGFLLVWVALLGAAYAYRKKLHVADDFFVKKLGPRGRAGAARGAFLVEIIFFAGVLGFGGARLVWITWQLGQCSSVLHWPMGAVYLVIPLSGLLMILFAAESWRERRGEGGT